MTADSVQERVRKFADDLRMRAQLSGGFMKPVKDQCGPWLVSLGFGTAEEMLRLIDLENEQRKRLDMAPKPKTKVAPTWHMAVVPCVPDGEVSTEDMSDLGMLCARVGIPQSMVDSPVKKVVGGDRTQMYWQWHE